MSKLRNQLRELLPEFQKQAKTLKEKEARRRWNCLRYVVKSKSTLKKSCLKVDRSEEWFRKWGKRVLQTGHISALYSHSRKPHKTPRRTHKVWEERVLMIRKARPFEGSERISQRIFDVYNKRLSPGVVHKILRRHGLVDKKKQKKLTKKHLKRYRRPLPGYLQMDFKYVPYRVNDRQYYQLSCVDHHSSWRMIRIYPNKDLLAVETFLIELSSICPFPIIEIQTDNDLAFTHKYWKLRMGFDPTNIHPVEEWCKENEIQHRLIPIGEKELNGKVENTHKQDDREFFSQTNPQHLEHLQLLSLAYEERWNRVRKTKAIGWKTPEESLRDAYIAVLAWFKLLGMPWPQTVLKIPKKTDKTSSTKNIKKTKNKKRVSQVSRYLKWMEEDAKKYGKSG